MVIKGGIRRKRRMTKRVVRPKKRVTVAKKASTALRMVKKMIRNQEVKYADTTANETISLQSYNNTVNVGATPSRGWVFGRFFFYDGITEGDSQAQRTATSIYALHVNFKIHISLKDVSTAVSHPAIVRVIVCRYKLQNEVTSGITTTQLSNFFRSQALISLHTKRVQRDQVFVLSDRTYQMANDGATRDDKDQKALLLNFNVPFNKKVNYTAGSNDTSSDLYKYAVVILGQGTHQDDISGNLEVDCTSRAYWRDA